MNINFSIELLDKIKNYQRPVRMILWVFTIIFVLVYIVVKQIKEVSPLTEVIILGMFADLGIYGVSRTVEKNLQAKLDNTQGVVDKVANSPNIDTKANIETKVNDTSTE